MPPCLLKSPSKARSSSQRSGIIEFDETLPTSSGSCLTETESSDSLKTSVITAEHSKKRSIFSKMRLQAFYRVAQVTQSPLFSSFIFILLACNLVYPLVEFLRCTALPEDYSRDMLEVEPLVMIAVGFRLCVLAGLPNLLLFVSGSGHIADHLTVQLGLDNFVWMATLLSWAYGLATVDEWTEDNIFVLSVCGLFSGIQINTKMAVHDALQYSTPEDMRLMPVSVQDGDNNSIDNDSGRSHADPDITVMSTLLTALKHLTDGSKLKFLFLSFTLGLQAYTKYYKNLLVGKLVDEAQALSENETDSRRNFLLSLFWVSLLVFANVIAYYVASALAASLVSNARARIQRELARRVLLGGSKFVWTTGTLTNTFNTNIAKEEAVFSSIMYKLFLPICHLTASFTLFCFIDVGYALFSLSVLPIVFIIKNAMEKRATFASEKFTNSSAQLSGCFQNLIGIRKAVEVYENQSFLLQRFEEKVQRTREDSFESVLWGFVFASSFNTTGTLLLLVTTLILLVALSRGKITAGDFFALSTFIIGMITPLEQLGSISGKIAHQSGAVWSIEYLLQYHPELNGSHEVYQCANGREVSLTLKKELTFDQVAFRYEEDRPFVLRDITATISAGSYVCVFGESGSGKSTILSLLEGFQKATGGRILMDGIDIASFPHCKLREKLGAVFQENFVLDGTVKENILFGYDTTGKGRQEIQEAVIEAAKDAQIHHFIMKLPNNYSTIIGSESQENFSGGQLQRICGLARAFIRKPELLLLDECTSALDTISEQAVIDTIVNLSKKKGMTVLNITHHPITAFQADKIFVIKNGKIEQSGTYASLISQPGLFSEIAEAGGHSSSKLGSSTSFFMSENELKLLERNN